MEGKKRYLYSVVDAIAEDYSPVFEAVSDPVAARQFRRLMGDVPQDMRCDYDLVRVGEVVIDGMSYKIVTCDPERIIVDAPQMEVIR